MGELSRHDDQCFVVVEHLFDLEKLDVEDQGAVGRDARKSLAAVGKVSRNADSTLTTDSHASNTNVPTLNDLSGTKLEAERLALLVGCRMLAKFSIIS